MSILKMIAFCASYCSKSLGETVFCMSGGMTHTWRYVRKTESRAGSSSALLNRCEAAGQTLSARTLQGQDSLQNIPFQPLSIFQLYRAALDV